MRFPVITVLWNRGRSKYDDKADMESIVIPIQAITCLSAWHDYDSKSEKCNLVTRNNGYTLEHTIDEVLQMIEDTP